MFKKIQKKKQLVAIILLIVFAGSVILSGAITLYFSFFNDNKPVSAQNDESQVILATSKPGNSNYSENITGSTPAVSVPDAENKTAANSTPSATASASSSANTESANNKTEITSLVNPIINYSTTGQSLIITAKVNAPENTVFSVVVMSTDMAFTKKANATLNNGVVNFKIDMPDGNPRSLKGSFQLSMAENAQPEEAVKLYGSKGEKILSDEKNGGRIVVNTDSDGKSIYKFDYIFDVKYK